MDFLCRELQRIPGTGKIEEMKEISDYGEQKPMQPFLQNVDAGKLLENETSPASQHNRTHAKKKKKCQSRSRS